MHGVIAPVLLLGTAACAAWGMALAGLLRAEAVLAVANGIFLVLILFGGVIIPADSLPGPLAALVPYLPSGALVEGFSAPLVAGQAPGAAPIVVLASWLTVKRTNAAIAFSTTLGHHGHVPVSASAVLAR